MAWRNVILPAWLAVTACAFAFALCAAQARAATELCPAEVTKLRPIGASLGMPAAAYAYDFTALTPRSVDATIVADTNDGWYSWSVTGVSVPLAHHVVSYGKALSFAYDMAESAPLAVAFPSPVMVRHAWVTTAKTSGESALGWDAKGQVSCDVPAFRTASDAIEPTPPPNVPPSAAATPSPLPSPLTAPARAAHAPAPFDSTLCAQPFGLARPVQAAMLEEPNASFSRSTPGSAEIAVAIDKDGNLLDAWVLGSSGNFSFDRAALRAAKASTYSGAMSYCMAVKSLNIFRAQFTP